MAWTYQLFPTHVQLFSKSSESMPDFRVMSLLPQAPFIIEHSGWISGSVMQTQVSDTALHKHFRVYFLLKATFKFRLLSAGSVNRGLRIAS